jgi:hypothetical protein
MLSGLELTIQKLLESFTENTESTPENEWTLSIHPQSKSTPEIYWVHPIRIRDFSNMKRRIGLNGK